MFAALFAHLLALVLALFPHAPEAPHYAPPAPTAEAPAPQGQTARVPHSSAALASPAAPAPLVWPTPDTARPAPAPVSVPEEVQEQRPEEVIGRQYDDDAGRICTVVDVELNTVCE